MSVLICFALKEEAAPMRTITAFKTGVTLLIVGIGRRNAETRVREFLATNSPQTVFTCGFAGGLNPGLKLGEVVFEPGSQSEPALPNLERLTAAGAKPVKFFCADRIATTITEKKRLRDETGADAVEMESAAIHAVCRERRIACITVRVILDQADENLPLDFNALARPDQSLDFGKLMLALAKSPRKIGALLALQKKTSFAAKQMAAVMAPVIFP